ncbi:nuclease-related domain-containing protein [Undibacterium arcticum]
MGVGMQKLQSFAALMRRSTAPGMCFYSRPWWGISPKGGELDGEADFILVHPDHGLLFLEVKGGAIAYDPTTDQWTSRDRNGIRHKIKDPVKQATTCKHQFLGRLKATQGWPSAFIRFRHGVIFFPDCESPPISGLSVGQYEKKTFFAACRSSNTPSINGSMDG